MSVSIGLKTIPFVPRAQEDGEAVTLTRSAGIERSSSIISRVTNYGSFS